MTCKHWDMHAFYSHHVLVLALIMRLYGKQGHKAMTLNLFTILGKTI